jgi:hypothetical protein
MERIISWLTNLTPVNTVPASPLSCHKKRLPEPEGESRQCFADDVVEYNQTPNATNNQEVRVDGGEENRVQVFALGHKARH